MVEHNSIGTSRPTTIKFLCSYGGKILPRYPDGKLRYIGGETRVLAVNRSIPFSELLLKLAELCGSPVTVSLRCQLPTEDLDALVSVTSDEDLANLVEEYDRAPSPPSSLKIRAFLSPPKSATKKTTVSPPSSSASSSSPRSPPTPAATHRDHRCLRKMPPPPQTTAVRKSATSGKVPYCAYHRAHGNPSQFYLIHNGNHWQ